MPPLIYIKQPNDLVHHQKEYLVKKNSVADFFICTETLSDDFFTIVYAILSNVLLEKNKVNYVFKKFPINQKSLN